MNKQWFGRAAICLAVFLALAAVIGCSAGKKSAGDDGKASLSTKSGDDGKASLSAKSGGKYSPEITITTARGVNDAVTFINNETMDDNVHTRWAKDTLGINLKNLWVVNDKNDGYNNKIRLSLSAGEKLPDVLPLGDINLINDLIDSGLIMSINEAFDKYASPRLKEIYSKYPEVWMPVSRDGKKYALPVTSGGDSNDTVGFVRKDWLDKLGLPIPTTLDEFEKTMDAFVNQDPDGNNKKDTLGISTGLNSSIWGKANAGDISWVFGEYSDFIPMQWQDDGTGKLVYSSIQPNAKQALSKIHEWFTKGYLDQEIGVMDGVKAAEKFVAGKSGFYFGAFWNPIWPLGDLNKNIPDAQLEAFKLPVGANGQTARWGSTKYTTFLVFNKDFKHMDAFFDYYDKLLGPELGESTDPLRYGYAEGYDYMMIDGKPVYDADKFPSGPVQVFKYNLAGQNIEVPGLQTKVYYDLYHGKTPETAAEVSRQGVLKEAQHGGSINYEVMDTSKIDQYMGPPTSTQKSKGEFLGKLEQETFTKIVYGDLPLDAFDKFITDWKSGGGDDIAKEVNEWYAQSK